MCTSCCGPTPTSYGYFTIEQNRADTTFLSSVHSAFCSALPFILTTASTLAFILTGHPLAFASAIVCGIWLLASITYEESYTRPYPRMQTVTQSVLLPTPALVPRHTHTHTTTYVVPPQSHPTVVMVPTQQPAPIQQRVFMQSQPPIQQPTYFVPPSPTPTRAPISRMSSVPRVEHVEVVSSGQLQRRASVGMRTHDSDNSTTRVAIAGHQVITQDQAQHRAPVGRREVEETTPVTLGGRAQVGRRTQNQ